MASGTGAVETTYLMRAFKWTTPTRYVFWQSTGGPDYTCSRAPEAESELRDIVVLDTKRNQ